MHPKPRAAARAERRNAARDTRARTTAALGAGGVAVVLVLIGHTLAGQAPAAAPEPVRLVQPTDGDGSYPEPGPRGKRGPKGAPCKCAAAPTPVVPAAPEPAPAPVVVPPPAAPAAPVPVAPAPAPAAPAGPGVLFQTQQVPTVGNTTGVGK